MKKINSILLVDDDKTTNFINEHLLQDLNIANHVNVALNGEEALDYLNKEGKFQENGAIYPLPDLILLDINMPVLDGFEFLEMYKRLKLAKRDKVVIALLTSLLTEQDLEHSKLFGSVVLEYITKPLVKNTLDEIIERHF